MTNEQQPEALRLADRLTPADYYEFDASLHCQQAAAELRRLYEENVQMGEQRDELLEALRMNAQSLAWLVNGKCRGFHPGLPTVDESLDAARSAIEKATGRKS